MEPTLIALGLACIVGAVVGGGLKIAGVELPVVSSWRRQACLAVLGGGILLAGSGHFGTPVSGAAGPACGKAPALVLNEICAEGKECVGLEDFVEIYNPTGVAADLRCYSLIDKKQHRKDLTGTLPSKQVAAWKRRDLGFGFSKSDDTITLARKQEAGREAHDETRPIGLAQTYQQRVPDGGAWEVMSHEAVKAATQVGTPNAFNKQAAPR